MTLRDVVARVREDCAHLGKAYLLNMSTAVTHFEQFVGIVDIAELSPKMIRNVMRGLVEAGATNLTANNCRGSLLYLWDKAKEFGWNPAPLDRREVKKFKVVQRVPTAWRPDQVYAIVKSCRNAETRRGWGSHHWEALVMTIYDTSLRVGCLLESDVLQLHFADCELLVPGEFQKGRRDTLQKIHYLTARLLKEMPRKKGDSRLFPWPFRRRELWLKFREDVLIPAGLPTTRRDMFHKLRRTSYTYVAKEFGIAAASRHASHREDLSRFYLDESLLDRPNPLDALPRPDMIAG